MRKLATALAGWSIVIGVAGWGVCLPFAPSKYATDPVVAGLGFITGAVLIAGGVVALSILASSGGESI
jgi:hypothetical protein